MIEAVGGNRQALVKTVSQLEIAKADGGNVTHTDCG